MELLILKKSDNQLCICISPNAYAQHTFMQSYNHHKGEKTFATRLKWSGLNKKEASTQKEILCASAGVTRTLPVKRCNDGMCVQTFDW